MQKHKKRGSTTHSVTASPSLKFLSITRNGSVLARTREAFQLSWGLTAYTESLLNRKGYRHRINLGYGQVILQVAVAPSSFRPSQTAVIIGICLCLPPTGFGHVSLFSLLHRVIPALMTLLTRKVNLSLSADGSTNLLTEVCSVSVQEFTFLFNQAKTSWSKYVQEDLVRKFSTSSGRTSSGRTTRAKTSMSSNLNGSSGRPMLSRSWAETKRPTSSKNKP